jgi:hypothetical protein
MDQTPTDQTAEAPTVDKAPREYDVRELVGERYRLRITANNKLILTK